ncbi:MAG TPA: hypothetical protein VNW15_11750 [Rhizomicrobium sp.]|nr:hypothetical protein [Rhizomicrobium sp.]
MFARLDAAEDIQADAACIPAAAMVMALLMTRIKRYPDWQVVTVTARI